MIRHYVASRGPARKKLWEHFTYVRNNKDRMRYTRLRVAGLPVGSGVTESTAKTSSDNAQKAQASAGVNAGSMVSSRGERCTRATVCRALGTSLTPLHGSRRGRVTVEIRAQSTPTQGRVRKVLEPTAVTLLLSEFPTPAEPTPPGGP